MDTERKKAFFFGGLIALAILLSVGYFFWGTVFNKGTVNFVAQPPFTVEQISGELLKCDTLPCQLKLKSGANELIFRKEGYRGMVQEVNAKLWSTVDFNVNFQVIPTIVSSDKFPEEPVYPKYDIGYDTKYKKYKLIADGEDESIVYFNNEINDYLIFGTEDYALIFEPKGSKKTTVYKVNVRTKSRDSFDYEGLGEIEEGVLSNSGNYLAFHKKGSDEIFILDTLTHKVTDLGLQIKLNQLSWVHDDSLIFATKRNFQSKNLDGKYQGDYIGFLEGEDNVLLFAAHHPDENTFSELASFNVSEISIKGLPDLLIAASNGQIIYLKSRDEKYKIVLKKF